MSTRRSRPPRTRKSRKPEAPQHDVVVTVPPDSPLQALAGEASPAEVAADDELEAVDAGWD
jgi:hypothetical protein